MNKYQIVVLRKLKSFGQFVTESRDEVNTYEFGEGDERPIIFGEKLKAVERRTIMRKTREVLGVNCWLTTSKKGADAGISGLCLSCPACALFGGTYAPKKGGTGGPRNAIEMRRVYYSGAFPFKGGGFRDITFNAVDERTGQTGRALGTNQVIEPRDFIDVVTVEANDENWVKLIVWGIEHSDRYGANVRIYGEIHNEVLGVLEDTRLRLAAIDLSRCQSSEDVRSAINPSESATGNSQSNGPPATSEAKQLALVQPLLAKLKPITCSDSEIEDVIKRLTKTEAVEDLARRKNSVDLSVDEYFQNTAADLKLKLPVKTEGGKETQTWKRLKAAERISFLAGDKTPAKSQFDLAREIEKANFTGTSDGDEEEK